MKHFITLSFLILIFFGANAQNDNKIIIGKVDSVYSTILDDKRKVWIYTPDLLNDNRDTSQRYPVVYLLDGDAHLASVAGMIQQLSLPRDDHCRHSKYRSYQGSYTNTC